MGHLVPDPPHHNPSMDKPCEICGDVGFADVIRLCCKCKVTREHAYCMIVVHTGEPEDWVCEECDSADRIPSSKPDEQPKDPGTRFMIRKPPQKTKVQYLPPEEAMVLESGAKKNFSPKKNLLSKTTVNKSPLTKKDPIQCTALPPKFSVKPNPHFGPPGFSKPLNNTSTPVPDKKLAALQEKEDGRIQNWNACQEPSRATINSAGISQKSNSSLDKGMRTNFHNAQPKNYGADGRKSLGVLLELDGYLLNHPAKFPTWKGRFDFPSNSLQYGSFDGIQAYPPCKVHRKVYELSKQLPATLKFELQPRLNYWVDLFEDDVPGALDIGLYFLSSKRPEQSYSCLLDYLDGHDMLLRCHVNEVELMVFSSRRLREDSQRINQEFFLWGLFRSLENSGITSKVAENAMVVSEEQPLTRVDPVHSPSPETHIISEAVQGPICSEYEGDDMDIDMSGGAEVGKVDVVVKKPTEGEPKCTAEDPKDFDILSNEASPKRTTMSGGYDVGRVDIVVKKPTKEELKESNEDHKEPDIPSKEASPKREASTVLELTPIKEEFPKSTGTSLDWMSCLQDELQFEKELQQSFDRFAKLMQSKEAAVSTMAVKKEPCT